MCFFCELKKWWYVSIIPPTIAKIRTTKKLTMESANALAGSAPACTKRKTKVPSRNPIPATVTGMSPEIIATE